MGMLLRRYHHKIPADPVKKETETAGKQAKKVKKNDKK